jgi:hypothetical protein
LTEERGSFQTDRPSQGTPHSGRGKLAATGAGMPPGVWRQTRMSTPISGEGVPIIDILDVALRSQGNQRRTLDDPEAELLRECTGRTSAKPFVETSL